MSRDEEGAMRDVSTAIAIVAVIAVISSGAIATMMLRGCL